MARTGSRVMAATVAIAMAGYGAIVALVGAPVAAANTYCGAEEYTTVRVQQATLPLQTATNANGWKWTDPAVQTGTSTVLTDYPLLAHDVGSLAGVNFNIWPNGVPGGAYGDGAALQDAMNNLQDVVQAANNPSAVRPATQAVMDAISTLNSDCMGKG